MELPVFKVPIRWGGALLFLFIIGIGLVPPSYAQISQFGQNKVQHTRFRWSYLATEHFNIYYTQEGRSVADYAAEVAEDALRSLSRRFRYTPSGEPITVIVYKSHNDFTQTNVTSEIIGEGLGGFTEFLRTRVVVPFEGDHEQFRHVIHHELTHAVLLDFLFGRGLGAVVSGITQTRLPIWFIEGLSEYESRGGIDSETEMFLRDAVYSDLVTDLNRLEELGYLGVYKCGQSAVYYIAWRYGDEKIGEILHKMKSLRDFDRALKASIGIDTQELSRRWQIWLKERYWPQLVEVSRPDQVARRLTHHRQEFCFVNNSPALSPNGEHIVFLSDRSDYFDLYLMRTIDGRVERRLVRGERSGKFEELHWLRPGITWSPDGQYIAFTAKAGKRDVLHIVEVKQAQVVKTLTCPSDGLFSPAWAPDGDRIALVKVFAGRSDIVVVDINTGQWFPVTDDIYDDADPSWSADGNTIYFTSNRGDAGSDPDQPEPGSLFGWNVKTFEVYRVDVNTREVTRLTYDGSLARTPLEFRDGILYVSNRSGVFNLYYRNLVTGDLKALSNIATGLFQPSMDKGSSLLAFTSFLENGYDIYLMNLEQTLGRDISVATLPSAELVKSAPSSQDRALFGAPPADYSHYVFDRLMRLPEGKESQRRDTTIASDRMERNRSEEGTWRSYDYKVVLEPDLIYVAASYSPYFKAQGTGVLIFSDVLSDHHLYLTTDLNGSTENSNLLIIYQYLAHRLDWGVGFYHFAYPFNYGRIRDRNWGVMALSNYPLNRFNRVELSGEYMVVERGEYRFERDDYITIERRLSISPHMGFVHDTAIWGSAVEPSNGSRWRADVQLSRDLFQTSESLTFTTFVVDWRKYLRYRKDFTFAFRLSGGASIGSDPQRFFLGGLYNWFNPRFDNPDRRILVNDIRDIYFASFVGPLRGVGYYHQIGTRYLLSNFEFRFPFIRHLVFGFPLPFYFRNIRGSFFTDWGIAWNPMDDISANDFSRQKGVFGMGTGIRLDLGIFPLQFDIAWSPSPSDRKWVPQYYLSLNTGF